MTTPVGGYPDDSFHFANIWCDEGIGEFTCEPIQDSQFRLVPNVFTDGSPWWDLTGRGETLQQPGSIYPSLFYRVMRPLAGDNVVMSVFLMRVVNVILSTTLIIGAAILLSQRARSPLFVSWIVVGPALGFYYLSSNHPSAWLLLGAGTFWAYLLGAIEARSTVKRLLSFAGVLIAGLIAVGSRPEGQIALALSGLVGVVASITDSRQRVLSYRIRRASFRSKLVGSVALGVAVLAGGLILIRSSVINSLAVDTLRERFGSGILNKLVEVPYLYVYVIGSNARITEQGTLGTQTALLLVGGVVLIAAGLSASWLSKWLLVVVVGIACLVAPFSIKVGDSTILRTPPRYLVAFLLLFVVAAAIQAESGKANWLMSAMPIATPLLVIGHSLALHSALRPYQLDVPPPWQFGLNGGLKWWWPTGPSPQTVWLIGTISFAAFLLTLSKRILVESETESS